MNILVIGNCQAEWIAVYLQYQFKQSNVNFIRILPADILNIKGGKINISELMNRKLLDRCDLLLTQNHSSLSIVDIIGDSEKEAVEFPAIAFDGFHPDMVYIHSKGNAVDSATGPYHSALAYFCWVNGLNTREAESLFCGEVFEELGYKISFSAGVSYLTALFSKFGLSFLKLSSAWQEQGSWMYTINHPKIITLSSLCDELLSLEPIDVTIINDPFEMAVKWGIYPDIASHLNTNHDLHLDGCYSFSLSSAHLKEGENRVVYGLSEFIDRSFYKYELHRGKEMACSRLDTKPFQQLKGKVLGSRSKVSLVGVEHSETLKSEGGNPYKGLPDYQFWRRAVVRIPPNKVDPVIGKKDVLKPTDKIATGGSCFAQHIAKRLEASGMTYYVSEPGEELTPEERKRRNFGVFSARYGNIYTVRQLRQLFDRAFGYLIPLDKYWKRPDGRFVDPFRPEIEPDGFENTEEVCASLAKHLQSVRTLFENLDVFIFTLGLTEGWRNRLDGCVYPLAPGVAAGAMNPQEHEFVNFGVNEIIEDLDSFIKSLRLVNPKARVLLTVSPVPLMATYENQHVLVANTYSKSVLRVVADEVCKMHKDCDYFPSFEIITGVHTRGAFFEDDLRSIKAEGVDQVMKTFLEHYTDQMSITEGEKISTSQFGNSLELNYNEIQAEKIRELEELNEIVCEEELLDLEDSPNHN